MSTVDTLSAIASHEKASTQGGVKPAYAKAQEAQGWVLPSKAVQKVLTENTLAGESFYMLESSSLRKNTLVRKFNKS